MSHKQCFVQQKTRKVILSVQSCQHGLLKQELASLQLLLDGTGCIYWLFRTSFKSLPSISFTPCLETLSVTDNFPEVLWLILICINFSVYWYMQREMGPTEVSSCLYVSSLISSQPPFPGLGKCDGMLVQEEAG